MRKWRAVPGGEPADPVFYSLQRCAECGTAATSEPSPADAYETGAYASGPPRLARPLRALKRLALGHVRRLLRDGVAPGARVLDAGAGSGTLVELLRDGGYDAYGIEPRDPEPHGPVLTETIEQHRASSLDAVVLWHVLEHLDDPRRALATAGGWLGPGGRLVVGVPNIDSLQAAVAGPKWFHLDAPRHRTHFSPRGLRELLGRSGFAVVKESQLVPEHNLHGMWFALLTRLGMTPGFPFHALKRNVPLQLRDAALVLVAGPVLMPVAIVLELLATALRRGGTIAVVARRQADS